MTQIIRQSVNSAVLLIPSRNKDIRHRLSKFCQWLDANGISWAAPDLQSYRDYLLIVEGLAPESVAVHLSTIRSRYKDLLLDRKLFFSLVPPQDSFAERKALVDELVSRITSAIDPRSARITTKKRQDRPDKENLRLSTESARELLSLPDTTTLAGLRDKAIIATLLCTGIREAELCSLQVSDLYQTLSGAPALHVRAGKGMKERLVPYGAMAWCVSLSERWLHAAGISDGPVFRGLRKGDKVRDTALNERTIQKLLAKYPIVIHRETIVVRPHDCRRTYARWLYDAGVKIDALRQNLGHDSTEMTFHYVGQPSVSDRLPPDVFQP